MKKFFSYILTFITLFVISAVVTIRIKGDNLQVNNPTTNVGASGQTSLLAGVMDSLQTNPKLDVSGNVSLKVDEQQIDLQLNANLDLTTLTNPSVMGSIGLTIDNQTYQILLTYTQNQIYLACENMSIQANVTELTDIIGLIASLTGQNINLTSEMPEFNLDSLMSALNNPLKTQVDDLTYYQITLPDIAKVTLVCDKDFNIQNISIDEVYLIENADVTCSLNVNQDPQINIDAPSNNASYLDVASLINNLVSLKDKNYLYLEAWTSVYKNKRLYQKIDANGIVSLSTNNYKLNAKLNGALTGKLGINYLEDKVYAKFNDIGVCADGQELNDIVDLFTQYANSTSIGKEGVPGQIVENSATLANQLIDWLANNYNSILDSATVASNQIVLVANLNGVLGQDHIKFILGLRDNAIDSVRIDGIKVDNYSVYATIYVREISNYSFEVNTNAYYQLSNVFKIVDWVNNLQTLDISANLEVDLSGQKSPVAINSQIDLKNNAQQISTTLANMPIKISQQNGITYINVSDIFVSVNNQTIGALLSEIVPQQQVAAITDKISTVISNLTINEILSFVEISTTQDTINIEIDLAHLVGKPCELNISIAFDNGIKLSINKFAFDNLSICGTVDIANFEEKVEVENTDKYLSVENFVDYVDKLVSSNQITISGQVDLQNILGINQKFDGTIKANFGDCSFEVIGKLSGKLNADIVLVYENDTAYVSYNKQNFKISKTQLVNLLSAFDINAQPIFDAIDNACEFKNSLSIKELIGGIIFESDLDVSLGSVSTDINIVQLVETVDNISINSNQIQIEASENEVNLVAQLNLSHNLGVVLSLLGTDYSIDASLEIFNQESTFIPQNQYIDLDLIVPRILATKNTLLCNNFNGTMFVEWGKDKQKISLDYQLFVNTETLELEFSISTTINSIYICVSMVDNQLYLQIADVYINVTLEQLIGIVYKLFKEPIDNVVAEIEQLKTLSTDDILQTLYNVTNSQPLIKNLYNNGLTSYITLFNDVTVAISGNKTVTFLSVKYKDFYARTRIRATSGESIVKVDNPQQYINVFDLIEYVEGYVTSSVYTISGEIDLSTGEIEQKFKGSIGLDFATTSIRVSGELEGKLNASIDIAYVNEEAYITYNAQNFKISKAELIALAAEFGVDIKPVFEAIEQVVELKNELSVKAMLGGMLSGEVRVETAEIDINSLAEILKAISINSRALEIVTEVEGKEIKASLGLREKLGVEIEVEAASMGIVANVEIQAEAPNFKTEKEYIDLGLLEGYPTAIQNTVECNGFAGVVNLELGNTTLEINYDIRIINNEIQLAVTTTYLDMPISVYIVDSEIYLQVNEIYANVTVEQLVGVLNTVYGEEISQLVAHLEEVRAVTVDEILETIYKITTEQTLLTSLTQIDNVLTAQLFNGIRVEIGKAEAINYVGVNYNGIDIAATVEAKTTEESIEVANAEQYINVFDLIEYVEGYVTSSVYTISGEIDLSTGEIEQKFKGSIGLDFATTSIRVSGELEGKLNASIDIAYVNEEAYITYNAQNFKISKAELIALAAEFGVDIKPVFEAIEQVVELKNELSVKAMLGGMLSGEVRVETAEIDINSLAEILKAISINSRALEIVTEVEGKEIKASLGLREKLGVEIEVEAASMGIVANVEILKTFEEIKVEYNYVNLDNASSTINGLINTMADNQFNGQIEFAWGTQDDQKVTGNYSITVIDKKIYATLIIEYLGQSATICILDTEIYLNIKDIYVKATFNQLKEILNAELPEEVVKELENSTQEIEKQTSRDIFDIVYDLTNQSLLDNLLASENGLFLEIKDADITLTTSNNKLSQIDVSYNQYNVSISIESSITTSVPTINTEPYIDIDNVYNLVKNVYNYAVGQQYYTNVNLSAKGYTITGYIGFDKQLNAQLYTTIENKKLGVTIVNNVVFIDFDGFKASIAFKDIPAFITELNVQFGLNIPQNILDIVDGLLNPLSTVKVNEIVKDLSFDKQPSVADILEKLHITLSTTSLFVTFEDISATCNYLNNMLTSVSVNYVLDAETQEKLTSTLTLCDKLEIVSPEAGVNVADATDLLQYVANLINTTSYQGTFTLAYKELELEGTHKIIIENGELSAQISTSYYDLPIEITIVNNTVYVLIDNIKIYVPLSQLSDIIGWINQSFEQNINNNISISTKLSDLIKDVSIDGFDIGNIIAEIVENVVNISYQDLSVSVILADQITAALTYQQDLYVTLGLQGSNNKITVIDEEYLHYTTLTNMVDSLVDLYNGKTIAATAMGYIYEGENLHYTATCAVQIDLAELAFYASVNVLDHFEDVTTEFMLAYRNNYWFVDYNSLKLKIVKTDLAEIMAILLDLVGIDPSLLPFLEGVAGGLSVNVDSLKAIVPKLDFGNPLTLIDVFEELKLEQNVFSVVIDNTLISDKLNVDNMTAQLRIDNGKLNYIALNNLYTGITDYEHLNFTLSLGEFNGVSEPNSGRYIDISGANELIKAVINTAELNYFEVQGTINLDLDIAAIGLTIDWDIPLNIKIRLDEKRKPEILISLGSIPSVAAINNDVPYEFGDLESSDTRMWYIYYKDSYVYMLREDKVDWYRIVTAGTRTYQKKLKAHVDSVFDDFFYYLQWGIGFTDTIMGAIEDALALSDNYNPDLGKVINSFTCTDKQNFAVDLNLQEISNNPQVKNVVIDLGVVNDQTTNYKNYVGTAELHMYMPIEPGTFEINLISEDLTLVNIGKSFDFSTFENFVYNYVGDEGVEYDRTWDHGKAQTSWTKAAERVYTIQFEEQGGATVSDISGKPGDSIKLPTLSNKVVLDSAAGKRYTYSFGGWYTTELCKNGTEFTDSVMPRSNKVLYAKWVLIATENVVVISFNSNGGTSIESVSGFAGTWIDVSTKTPTKATTWVDNGYNWVGKNAGKWTYVYTYYTFAGWYTDSACTKKFDGYVPSSNTTLYAKWNISTETKYHYNWDRP